MKGGKLIWCVSCRGELKVLIEFITMCGGVYMSKILCVCLCLSYINPYWLSGTSFPVPWSRCLIWWIGVHQSMGCNSQVVYFGHCRVHLLFWHLGSVLWCYHPELLLCDWVYCSGDIGHKRVFRFVWWVGWPVWVPFFCFLCELNTFVL